ncbi:hypothetical protein PN499_07900 [Kamptonema animale CS-326]|nr:hypothetical protein [Kamptonema animale]MDB9511102.1 hypothetical protein [Kamptonema animale CS-326]
MILKTLILLRSYSKVSCTITGMLGDRAYINRDRIRQAIVS